MLESRQMPPMGAKQLAEADRAKAALGVGNEPGPLHLAAAGGAPTIVLFSRASDPKLSAPRGRVAILRAENLSDLPVAQVAQAANSLAPSPTAAP